MILPPETEEQIRKNKLYMDNVYKVRFQDQNKFYEYVLRTGKLPKITPTGYILYEVNFR